MKASQTKQLYKMAQTAAIRANTLLHIERSLELYADNAEALAKAIQGALDNNRREEFSLAAIASQAA